MEKIGRIERIDDLRTIWKNEEYDFSKWLAEPENLSELSDAVGVSIQLEERESPVGKFNVDIFATEEDTGRKIVIENQLEDTNHDHLGKIITYAAGKDASLIIWIVKHAKEEHKKAVEWLNNHLDESIGIFLIEIELWKIGESLPAPKFNVVEQPNDWAKSMKSDDSVSDTKKLEQDFWESFNEYAKTNSKFIKSFSLRSPRPQQWYDFAVGTSDYHLVTTVNSQKNEISIGIYIRDNKELYSKFMEKVTDIEKIVGDNIIGTEAQKACKVKVVKDKFDLSNKDGWNTCFEWMSDMLLKFKQVTDKFGK